MKDKKKLFLIILLCVIYYIIQGLIIVFLLLILYPELKINNDITKYNDYIGSSAKKEYKIKWGMDESIFPKSINNLNVLDYKMVYYNPWDAQYLSYLVVKYDKDSYTKEVNRLSSYNSTTYKGYYSVTGFTKYKLLAIYADSYHGFVYAITDNSSKIIYVEIIFCNYFMDLNYKKYINNNYLPDGFDATKNNKYLKENR